MNPLAAHNNDDSAASAMCHAFTVAAAGAMILEVLEMALPASGMDVEHKSRELTESFTMLMNEAGAQANSSGHVSRIIRAMQFQDRNTQTMDDAARILRHYRLMLEETCRHLRAAGADAGTHPAAMMRLESLLSSVHLSDMRHRLTEALEQVKLRPALRGKAAATPAPENNAELF